MSRSGEQQQTPLTAPAGRPIMRKTDIGGIDMTPEEMNERDILEFTDDEGHTLLLQVTDYFFYNGEEYEWQLKGKLRNEYRSI